jgi:AraC-like DNA-binding protein
LWKTKSTITLKKPIYWLLFLQFLPDISDIKSKTIELVLSVFFQAQEQIDQKDMQDSDISILHEVKAYIDVHYSEGFHMEDLSRRFGINEFKLKKGFKIIFGDTVFSYVRKQRLQNAYILLTASTKDVKEVAFLSGYKYAHHFTQAFFAEYGVKPSKLKANLLKI